MIASRFLRYGVIGLLTNFFGYLFFIALLSTGLPAVLTTGITYVSMVGASYVVNRRWTFRSDSSHARDVPRYVIAYGIGFLVSIGSMHALARYLHPEIAQVLVIGLSAVVIYSALELFSFGRRGRADDRAE